MDPDRAQPTSFKQRGPYVALALVALALAIAGAVTWFVLDRPRPLPPEPVAVTPVADAGVAQAFPAVDIAAGEPLIGDLVPAEWLSGGDAIRRAAAAVSAISEGQSPRVVLSVLQPDGAFTVDEHKGKKKKEGSKFFISEKNDARYDKVTLIITSMDAAAVGRLYAKVRPYLEAAFREISPPGKTFDGAFTAAVDRLAAVPITDGPREVVPMEQGTGFAWADPKLEALKPAEKHLLRMGPKNARAVVAQLKAFRAAMQ